MKTNFLNTFLYQFEDFQNEQNQEDFSGVFLYLIKFFFPQQIIV